MKHWLVIASLLLMLGGCGTTGSHRDEPLLLGWTNRAAIMSPAHPRFGERFDTVQVSGDMIDLIREAKQGEWLVFFGSWCSDSWREIPAFLKVADNAGIDSIRFYGLDRSKKSPGGFEEPFDITLVPTLILLSDGKEVGRIEERPAGGMEDDMLFLLMKSSGE
jgi:thiol-disulfide isomerase/thioredoxin